MSGKLLSGFEYVPSTVRSCKGCALDSVYQVTSPDEREAHFGVTCYSSRCHEGYIIVAIQPTTARANDPHTSKVAAAAIAPKRASIKHHILTTLCTDNPADGGGYAWTGTEIAAKNGLRLNSVTPRFAEMRRANKIKPTTTVRNGEIAWVLYE